MRVLKILTFTELEPFAGFWPAWFFSFNFARVAGDETICLKGFFAFLINFYEGSGNAKTKSFSLAFYSATVKIYNDIIFISSIQKNQRLGYDILKCFGSEIFFIIPSVNSNFAFAIT